MATFKVVAVDITSNCSSGFFDIIVLCQIGFFIFETAKPPFNHDVIRPSAFPIHSLADSVLFHEIYVALAVKLTPLIEIQNPRLCSVECFFQEL